MYFGTSPNVQATHVRRGGDDRVFEASMSAFDVPAGPSSWVNRRLVDLVSDDVTSIEVANRHGRFALENRDGEWRVTRPSSRVGRTASTEDVMNLVRPLAGLNVSEPVGPRDVSHGLDDPAATVTLRTGPLPAAGDDPAVDAGMVVTLEIGGETGAANGERYVSKDGFGFVATLSKSNADRALDQKLSDLLN